MPGENLLQTLQRYATIVQRLDDLATVQREFTKAVAARLDRVETQIADIRERLARLETARNADRAEMQAEISRFKVEVERAELQLTRLLSPREEETEAPRRTRKRGQSDKPNASAE